MLVECFSVVGFQSEFWKEKMENEKKRTAAEEETTIQIRNSAFKHPAVSSGYR